MVNISIDKKSRLCFLEENQFLDKNLNPIRHSKKDTIISTVESNALIRTQIYTTKDSFYASDVSLKDWLYAECIKNGIFKTDENYVFTYLREDNSNGEIFKIYALPESSMSRAKIIIPDIFLPMVLENIKEESYLFLFEKEIAFYHHHKLVYHIAFKGINDILKTIEYISLVYGVSNETIYTLETIDRKELNLSITPLNLNQHHAQLAFEYVEKSQKLALPMLIKKEAFCIKNSLTFRWLLKIACVIFLITLYPMGEYFQSLYFKNKFEFFRDKNLALLQEISSLRQVNSSSDTHIQSLHQAQISYMPRYKLIANLANELWEKEIFLKELYFNSDILDNTFTLVIDISSLSQNKIVELINTLKNSSEIVFSDTFNQEEDKVSTQIVWVSNAS